MSLREGINHLIEHQQRVQALIDAAVALYNSDNVTPTVIELAAEARLLEAGDAAEPSPTRKRRIHYAEFPRWCANPECPNKHYKQAPGATKFMAHRSDGRFCSNDCRKQMHLLESRRKNKASRERRADLRAKAGLPPIKRGRPRKDAVLAIKPVGFQSHLANCKRCRKDFRTAPGLTKFCKSCRREIVVQNAAAARKGLKLKRLQEARSVSAPAPARRSKRG